MASNFAFQAYGLSQPITVGSTPTTISWSVVNLGGSTATVGTSGRYQAPAVRLALEGTCAVFLQVGGTVGTVTVGVNTGMKMLQNSVEVFSIRGAPIAAFVCASTFTTTIQATLGEGM